jgi:hypothetical protein
VSLSASGQGGMRMPGLPPMSLGYAMPSPGMGQEDGPSGAVLDYRSVPGSKPRDYPSPHGESRRGPGGPPVQHHPHSGIPSPVGYPPHPDYRPLSNPGSMMPPVSVPGPPPPVSAKRAPSQGASSSTHVVFHFT